MDDAVLEEPAASAVAALAGAVDGLLAMPLAGFSASSVMRLIAALEVQRNRLAAVDARVLAAAATSGAVAESGSTSVGGLLMSLTRCSRGEARARVSRAVDLGPRATLAGQALDPIHPRTAAAVACGVVSEAQAEVIVAALGRIRPDADPATFDIAEAFLVESARHLGPRELGLSAASLLAHLDPDGLEPAEATLARARSFGLRPARDGGGGMVPTGRLSDECAAVLRAVLDALAKPRTGTGTGTGTGTVDGVDGADSADGDGDGGGGVEVRDERSGGQRYHDALLELALRVLRSGDLPDSGGTPASVIITVPAASPGDADTVTDADADDSDTVTEEAEAEDGRANERAATGGTAASGDTATTGDTAKVGGTAPTGGTVAGDPADAVDADDAAGPSDVSGGPLIARLAGVAQLGDGTLVRLEHLGALLDECEITTATLTATGGIADYGRERRTATPAMRRALTARDGGCAFPGCDRPASWTEAHHVIPWLDGGPTSLANLCLLCAHHHRAFGPAGWQVIMRHGVPTWIPPAWLDPDRYPVINTSRHLAKITFAVPTPEIAMRT